MRAQVTATVASSEASAARLRGHGLPVFDLDAMDLSHSAVALVREQKNRHFDPDIVEAFEAEGFVWGGKWRFWDAVHFEFRPEILILNGGSPRVQAPPAALDPSSQGKVRHTAPVHISHI